MQQILASARREPVRWFTGLQLLVAFVLQGVLLFSDWDPSTEQLTYIIAAPSALGAIFGFTIVRQAVTPNAKLPEAVVQRAASV